MRQQVADHYVAKGYRIRERVRVRGASGTIHMAEMVAQGPLGAMLIAFEDEGGFEGPEFSAIKRAAKDVGAQAVAAARHFPDALRRRAAEVGVVLLDEESLTAPEPDMPEAESEPEFPPWPGVEQDKAKVDEAPWPGTVSAGRMVTQDVDDMVASLATPTTVGKSTDPGFWSYPREGAQRPPRPQSNFEWLPDDPEPAPMPSVEERVEQRAAAMAERTPPKRVDALRLSVAALLFGATAGGVLYALSRILG